MTIDSNNYSRALEHDHDGDGPCPLCRDGEPLLSADDFGRLSLAMTIGTGRHDAAAVGQLFNGAVNARLLNRLLDVALLGHLLPCAIYASGEVAWRPTNDLLSAAEITRYRAEFQRVTVENGDAAPGSLLTGGERRQLALATAAGFGGQDREVEQTVLEWAEVARDMAQNLDGILTGRLVPYVADDDPERLIQVKDVEELPVAEKIHYRRAFDMLATAHNE
jgi:hypothetical protein